MAEELKAGAIRAAGGVLWRRANGTSDEPGIEIALIHRPQYDDWTIPKGKLAPGETEVEGAVREVLEETGYRVRLGRPLGEVRYPKSVGDRVRTKVVRYWAMEADGGGFTPTREVDELKWVTLADAQELLTYPRDRELLEKFVQGRTAVGSVLLVRHASAGSRESWHGDDRLRPLDDFGVAQAEELVRLLARFEVDEVVSADYVRCVQSVEPLARSVGLKVTEMDVFSETGFPGNEAKAVELLRGYGESHQATVVCSQGDVIPELLDMLASEDHVSLPDPLPNKKASVWSLTFDGPRLFSAEYFAPPAISS